jgi:hypothetical protein
MHSELRIANCLLMTRTVKEVARINIREFIVLIEVAYAQDTNRW